MRSRAGFAYTGLDYVLAAAGGATFVRDPNRAVVGAASGGVGRAVWTDLHDDVVGQFAATGTALSGSQSLSTTR